MHGSAQRSYKNKNVLKMFPCGFVFLSKAAFNQSTFKFQTQIILSAFQKQDWKDAALSRYSASEF